MQKISLILIILTICYGCNVDSGRRAAAASLLHDSRIVAAVKKDSEILSKESPSFFTSGSPIQKTFADAYVKAYKDTFMTKLNTLMNNATTGPILRSAALASDYYSVFSFDSTTMGAFADMYNKGQIDGIRVYLAKYTKNSYDEANSQNTRFTIILAGTVALKDTSGNTYYKDVLVPIQNYANIYRSLEDYGDPCKPPPACPGITLGN